jgi:mannosylglycerate hydrolase
LTKSETSGVTAGRPAVRHVHVVPHTHWDREWYLPFQRFRLRLVDTVDALLADLRHDPAFRHFLLDGQMAAIDDYLAVRPEQETTLRSLAAAGRVAMGPWYTQPDEFLVSGETLIRDLQAGLARADELGAPMEVGYLPDMFGHVAQMPQLFRLFGFEHAVVFRGVPAACTVRTGFWWEAPDGSRVRAEYLPSGYGNGAGTPEDPIRFVERIASWEADNADRLGDGPLLWMNGGDHQGHQPFLPEVVAKANAAAGDRYHIEITSLAAHLAAAPTEGLPVWRGELRSSARANLLMNVASNRVDVKQAAGRAERLLEQVAEPLHAALLPDQLWPDALLREAWHLVLLDAAHDSICACSDDEVVVAVLERYAEARQIAEGLTERALGIIGAALAVDGPVVVNTLARHRGGLVELVRPGTTVEDGEQLVEVQPDRVLLHRILGPGVGVIVERELDVHPDIREIEYVDADDGAFEVVLHTDPDAARLSPEPVVSTVRAALERDPQREVRILLVRPPTRRVLVDVAAVPGLGWAPPRGSGAAPVTVDGWTMTNGLATVAVGAGDATFALDGHHGLGRLVDDGDAGDTYNWCPPDVDHIVDTVDVVDVEVVEHGPMRGIIQMQALAHWPTRVDAMTSERVGSEPVTLTTTLELRAGERFVRVRVAVDNRCRDHRLRALFPLPEPAEHSVAECAFATVERGLVPESGPTEAGLPTYPSRRFVQAGGLTVAHEGLLEYELVDVRDESAHALALTLLRATRFLSRGPMATRPLPAGPVIELHGSQVQGHHELRYVVAVGDIDPYALAEDAFVPLLVATGAGMGRLPGYHQALAISGARVSAVVLRNGALHVRAFNPSDRATTLRVPGRRGDLVDLRDRVVAPFDGELELRPWQIATLRLHEPSR